MGALWQAGVNEALPACRQAGNQLSYTPFRIKMISKSGLFFNE